MSIHEKLAFIQQELKTPKGQYNSFGKYKYRSCEDILEAAKPVIHKHGCTLTVGDELVHTGDRYYVKATATLYDCTDSASLHNTAYAREEEAKKGMDGSQITGTASSYARKYALNGLFCLDDTKDADTNEHAIQTSSKQSSDTSEKQACIDCGNILGETIKKDGEVWSATDIAQYSSMRFGRVLCPSCQKIAFKVETE